MDNGKRLIPLSGLRTAAEYIRNAIMEAVNERIVIVRHVSENTWHLPEYLEDGSLLIVQAYETIQNGTVLEVK